MTCRILIVTFGAFFCFGALFGWSTGQSPSDALPSKLVVKLPAPPARPADAAARAATCLECHDDMAELFEDDKHVAEDVHCVVCHGTSDAHLEMEIEGALPDRTWRRWLEEEHCYEWRVKRASLEIAKFCASCHGRKSSNDGPTKTISWEKYLATGHGRAVYEGKHDAATCSDCHYAHGTGCETLTDETINDRCGMCHADREMMQRAGLDSDVMDEFVAGTHENMDAVDDAMKASCIKCHPPH